MALKKTLLSVSLGLALTDSALAGTLVIEEPEVRTIVTEAGYGDPVVVKHDGNYWRVKSIDDDSDREVTLFVNADGEIVGAGEVARTRITETTTTTTTTVKTPDEPMNESSVATVVMNAGFHNVHDIDYLDHRGVWKAEADDITGEDFELHVDANGRIVHIEDD